MATNVTFDTTAKVITVDDAPVSGVVTVDIQRDLYSEAKRVWLSSLVHNRFRFPFRTVGGDPIDASVGSAVPLYAFLQYGWKIQPFDASHTMNVVGGVLLVEGGGDPFIDTVGTHNVRINYQQPVQAITVQLDSGTGLDAEQTEWLRRLYAAHFHKRTLVGNEVTIFEDDGTTPLQKFDTSGEIDVIDPQP